MKARSIVLAAIGLLLLPAVALAGPYDWPNTDVCSPTENPKQTVKMFSQRTFSGGTELECGNTWDSHGYPTWTTLQTSLADKDFDGNVGVGSVGSFNDLAKSLVLANKATNHGVCWTMYVHWNWSDGGLMDGHKRYSVWVGPRLDGQKYRFVALNHDGGTAGHFGASSGFGWHPEEPDHDTKAECQADSDDSKLIIRTGYKTDAGTIVWD